MATLSSFVISVTENKHRKYNKNYGKLQELGCILGKKSHRTHLFSSDGRKICTFPSYF
jgi:hypothetical protein